ncbi:MAG: hypothetical protein ACO3GK_01560 [Bacteroidia bacterium]
MSSKRHKSFFSHAAPELEVLAIHSQLSPHRLAWCLDDTFSSCFICEPNQFEVTLPNQPISLHVEFHFEGNEVCSPMSLIENRGTSQQLYAGRPTPDFWLVVQEPESMGGIATWLEGIKSIPNVQMAYLFPAENHPKLSWLNNIRHL